MRAEIAPRIVYDIVRNRFSPESRWNRHSFIVIAVIATIYRSVVFAGSNELERGVVYITPCNRGPGDVVGYEETNAVRCFADNLSVARLAHTEKNCCRKEYNKAK